MVSAASVAGGVAMVPVILLLLRRTGLSRLAGNAVCLVLFLVLTAMAFVMGGHVAPAILWYAVVPIAATSMAGQRAGLVWLGISLLALGAFGAADYVGLRFRDDLTISQHRWIGLMALLGLIAVIAVLASLFESFKDQMLGQVRQSQAALAAEREQMLAMFDGMDEVVYVADPQTYELLYLNAPARQAWGQRVGEPCYRALQNRETPCPFCTNDRIFGDNVGQSHI